MGGSLKKKILIAKKILIEKKNMNVNHKIFYKKVYWQKKFDYKKKIIDHKKKSPIIKKSLIINHKIFNKKIDLKSKNFKKKIIEKKRLYRSLVVLVLVVLGRVRWDIKKNENFKL